MARDLKSLRKQIESIFAQALYDWELDDAMDTVDILERICYMRGYNACGRHMDANWKNLPEE